MNIILYIGTRKTATTTKHTYKHTKRSITQTIQKYGFPGPPVLFFHSQTMACFLRDLHKSALFLVPLDFQNLKKTRLLKVLDMSSTV